MKFEIKPRFCFCFCFCVCVCSCFPNPNQQSETVKKTSKHRETVTSNTINNNGNNS